MAAHTHSWFTRVPSVAFALTLGTAALVAPVVLAGEVKVGAEPLETKDNGALTDAGRKAAVDELPSEPGEDVWVAHLWAKLDRAAPGPLYVEFFDTLPGSDKRYMAHRHEHPEFEGGQYISLELELDGNTGFNKDHTYTIEFNQLNDKGKNVKLASGTVTLVFTEAEKEPADDKKPESAEGDEGGGDDLSEQDVLDSFAGGDANQSNDEAPPEVTPPSKKKGCHVEPGVGAAPGVLLMLVLGASVGRRRRRS